MHTFFEKTQIKTNRYHVPICGRRDGGQGESIISQRLSFPGYNKLQDKVDQEIFVYQIIY